MAVIATRPIYTPQGGSTSAQKTISQQTAQQILIRGFTFELRERSGVLYSPPGGKPIIGFIPPSLTLVLPPESLSKSRRSKNSITETQLGQWVDSIGLAAPRWQISGTFGFKLKARDNPESSGGTRLIDGFTAHVEFEAFVQEYFEENRKRALSPESTDPLEMWFLDWEDDDMWQIEPEMIPEKNRTNDRPMLRNYAFSFLGIRNLLQDGGRNRDLLAQELTDRKSRMKLLVKTLESERANLVTLLSEEAKQGWGEVVNNAMRKTTAWIDGVTDDIEDLEDQTIGEAIRVAEQISVTIEVLAASARAVDPNFLFADAIDTFRQIKCGIGVLVSFPEQFMDRFSQNMENFKNLFTESGCSSTLPSEKPNVT